VGANDFLGSSLAVADTNTIPAPQAEIEEGKALARIAGLEFVDLNKFSSVSSSSGPQPRAAVLPEQFAKRHLVAPIGWERGIPVVAIASPENVLTLDDIRAAVGGDIRVVVAAKSQIAQYLENLYQVQQTPKQNVASNATIARFETSTKTSKTPETDFGMSVDAQASNAIADFILKSQPFEQDYLTEAPETQNLSQGTIPLLTPNAAIMSSDLTFDDIEIPSPTKEAKPTLEQILLDWSLVSKKDMETAITEKDSTGHSLRDVLLGKNLVTEEDLTRATAVEAGFKFVDLNSWEIDKRAVDLIPEATARRYKVLGIGFHADKPVIAMANPMDVFAMDDVRTIVGGQIEAFVCKADEIENYISRFYQQTAEADLFAQNAALTVEAEQQAPDLNNLLSVVDDAPIVKFVNLILKQALNQRASDIHLEPSVDNILVRFRIDGVLHHITSAPKAIHAGVVSRLKIMADLDIAEHRIPQDGRISLRVGSKEIDLRVATLPTVHGEKVALRVLDKTSVVLDLEKLGFQPDVLKRYEISYKKPYGTILVTGPTGSGKSTTLYATLAKLNTAERNLITVEDPVEYQMRGINQVQVNPKAGLSFASALRSILRSDPDVVLVGEIRDRDTATIAIEAALTGHLVLSCLHTNDAAGTPMRLIEMGVEPFLVGSALDCVLGQRLARVLCHNCAEPINPTEQDLLVAGFQDMNWLNSITPQFRRAVGCQACGGTGYHGRMSIQEVMLITEEIERAVITRTQTSEIQKIAVEQGMQTMRQDGLRKAALGYTSLEEILRVVI
jgi:type IV pilus assembly protein PilB